MKKYVIIPMGGIGKRFLDAGYKKYKPFLPIDKKITIFDKIINNFNKSNIEFIIVGEQKKIKKYRFDSRRKFHFVDIKSHSKGPLYSIYLAKDQINKIVEKNSIFICYSDINFNWIW
jgi:choline kinase